MNQSFSRQSTNPYVATINPYSSARRDSYASTSHGRFSRTLKRLFKFPQMDFEVAVWEMTSLIIAPKKVFRNMYYHKQTTSTSSTTDPAFAYLLLLFTFLTSLAWSLAYASPSFGNIIQIAFFFTALHCLLGCLLTSTLAYFALPRLLGPGGALAGIQRRGLGVGRQRGLFGAQTGVESDEKLEWSYCFDVSLRAFFPLWVWLYVLQFVLLPVLTSARFLPSFLSNTLYALAFVHATYIQFLGYGSLPFLTGTQVLLSPLVAIVTVWLVASVGGWNLSRKLAPVLWCAANLRGGGVGGYPAYQPHQ